MVPGSCAQKATPKPFPIMKFEKLSYFFFWYYSDFIFVFKVFDTSGIYFGMKAEESIHLAFFPNA